MKYCIKLYKPVVKQNTIMMALCAQDNEVRRSEKYNVNGRRNGQSRKQYYQNQQIIDGKARNTNSIISSNPSKKMNIDKKKVFRKHSTKDDIVPQVNEIQKKEAKSHQNMTCIIISHTTYTEYNLE
jgi:hypothetical protein